MLKEAREYTAKFEGKLSNSGGPDRAAQFTVRDCYSRLKHWVYENYDSQLAFQKVKQCINICSFNGCGWQQGTFLGTAF